MSRHSNQRWMVCTGMAAHGPYQSREKAEDEATRLWRMIGTRPLVLAVKPGPIRLGDYGRRP